MADVMRHSTREEKEAYEAMIHRMSVEIYPVDRDALLELADAIEDGFCLINASKETRRAIDHINVELRRYAGLIREALGVIDHADA